MKKHRKKSKKDIDIRRKKCYNKYYWETKRKHIKKYKDQYIFYEREKKI